MQKKHNRQIAVKQTIAATIEYTMISLGRIMASLLAGGQGELDIVMNEVVAIMTVLITVGSGGLQLDSTSKVAKDWYIPHTSHAQLIISSRIVSDISQFDIMILIADNVAKE